MTPQEEAAIATYVELVPHLYRYLDAANEIQTLAHRIDEGDLKAVSFVDRFIAEATRLFPQWTTEHHREVGELLERELRSRKADIEALSSGLAPLGLEDLDWAWLQGLNDAIQTITGDATASIIYLQVWPRVARSRWGSDVLLPALLTTAIGDFEVLVARYVRSILTLRPQILNLYERTYTVSDIRAFDTIEALEAEAIDDRADRIMTGGYESWAQWLLDRGIVIDGTTRNPDPVLLEAFQRRHLFVHKGGEVDSAYVRKVPGTEFIVGDEPDVTAQYLVDVVDAATIAALKISSAAFKHFTKGSPAELDALFDYIAGHSSYTLLSNCRFGVVANYEEWAAQHRSGPVAQQIAVVNGWLARKRLGQFEDIRAEVEGWDPTELGPKFSLAKHALLDAVPEAHALARRLIEDGDLELREYLEWPLLAEARAYDGEIQDPSEQIAPHGS
ncbi:hypothetical protein [Demequina sp. NBRC 110054]|uniref:hypothetical protein n=1 Tax=Demequina sp. NBRC 110054 TaxID=1570343 RepID=UPI000A05670E|nr:hypothetical protein [Demequina sp. NBRC 110054]